MKTWREKDEKRNIGLNEADELENFNKAVINNDYTLKSDMQTNVFGVYVILEWVEPIDSNKNILNVIFENNKKISTTSITRYSPWNIWHVVGIIALVMISVLLTVIITVSYISTHRK